MSHTKKKIYAALAGVGITLGAAGAASAASTATSSTAAPVAVSATAATTPADRATPATAGSGHAGRSNQTPTWTSSVTVPVPTGGSQPTDAELQAVATVTADQATAAALANTPGTAGDVVLKSVAGNVVWEVDVTATAGGSYDVIVDAGNATVLDTHPEGHGGGPGGHHHGQGAPNAGTATATT